MLGKACIQMDLEIQREAIVGTVGGRVLVIGLIGFHIQ